MKSLGTGTLSLYEKSPPSRAAWIEIYFIIHSFNPSLSPPSRAAWIEIDYLFILFYRDPVAAFTGGVD